MTRSVAPAPVEWRTGGITTTGVTPQQGSKTLRTANDGRQYMAEPKANELRAFRAQVDILVKAKYRGLSRLEPIHPEHTPVAVRVLFRMPLRKSDPAPETIDPSTGAFPVVWFTVAPDIDKMCRAVFDALTGAYVWKDDAQACHVQLVAVRHPNVGALIEWRGLGVD